MAKVYVKTAMWIDKGENRSGRRVELVVLYSNNTYSTHVITDVGGTTGEVITKYGGSWMDFVRWFDMNRLRNSGFTKRQANKYISYKAEMWKKYFKFGKSDVTLDYSEPKEFVFKRPVKEEK